jgi:hypothetical protein
MLETVLAHIDSAPRDKQRGGSKSKLVVVLYTALPMNITALVTDPRVSAIVQVQKKAFFQPLLYQRSTLPRQAPDKHRKS